jgi:hypothetical protein
MAAQPQPQPIPAPERTLREDLERAPFTSGVDRGWWRLRELDFPFAVIEVACAPRPGSPEWLALRFNVSAYPEAPSAQPWDVEANGPLALARWPSGSPRILGIFNPSWRPDALYFPMDGLALEGHDAWRTQHACHTWDPAKDISQYLRLLHELLNEEGYTGVRG